jgi:tetratricopeptide (TPR) repeat protein
MAKAKPKPKPQAKTKPKPQRRPSTSAHAAADPALDSLTKGLAALQKKDWPRAAALLEKAVALADRPELRDRARQFLAASQAKAQAEASKPARGSDPYLQAVFEKNRGHFKEALEICRRGGRDQKDERFAYLSASIHALENRLEEAAQALARAIEMNATNRIHAFHDSDFAELRKNRDYRSLFGLS